MATPGQGASLADRPGVLVAFGVVMWRFVVISTAQTLTWAAASWRAVRADQGCRLAPPAAPPRRASGTLPRLPTPPHDVPARLSQPPAGTFRPGLALRPVAVALRITPRGRQRPMRDSDSVPFSRIGRCAPQQLGAADEKAAGLRSLSCSDRSRGRRAVPSDVCPADHKLHCSTRFSWAFLPTPPSLADPRVQLRHCIG